MQSASREDQHFYGRWSPSRWRGQAPLYYPTTPALYPSPLTRWGGGASAQPPESVDSFQQQRSPRTEKSEGVVMHELLSGLDDASIDEIYSVFVVPGLRLVRASATPPAGNGDLAWPGATGEPRSVSNLTTSSNDRGCSVMVVDDAPTMPAPAASSSGAAPQLVHARIVSEVEDRLMHPLLQPTLASFCCEQAPPLMEAESRRRITVEEHERDARLDLLRFESSQRSIAQRIEQWS